MITKIYSTIAHQNDNKFALIVIKTKFLGVTVWVSQIIVGFA